MTAILVEKGKLKIHLEHFEMTELFKVTGSISCKDPEMRYILKIILGKAITKTGFKLDCERLKVELFPSVTGGCVIYFTKLPHYKRFRQNREANFKFTMEFSSCENAVAASKTFKSFLLNKENSSLYKLEERYYLVVSSAAGYPLPFPVVKEFADSLHCSNTAAAIVSEYGNLMISDNAIEKLATL